MTGVQRDLLPIIEGSTVGTKYGNVNTDHILFICSGAFHHVKPSDMLAELQGRLPIRVELKELTKEDFYRWELNITISDGTFVLCSDIIVYFVGTTCWPLLSSDVVCCYI